MVKIKHRGWYHSSPWITTSPPFEVLDILRDDPKLSSFTPTNKTVVTFWPLPPPSYEQHHHFSDFIIFAYWYFKHLWLTIPPIPDIQTPSFSELFSLTDKYIVNMGKMFINLFYYLCDYICGGNQYGHHFWRAHLVIIFLGKSYKHFGLTPSPRTTVFFVGVNDDNFGQSLT